MKNFGNSSRGRSQGAPKIFRAPTYRAHCAVFAIAQLSHEVPHWLYISKFTRFRAVSRRQHGSCPNFPEQCEIPWFSRFSRWVENPTWTTPFPFKGFIRNVIHHHRHTEAIKKLKKPFIFFFKSVQHTNIFNKPVGDWTPRLAQMSLTHRPWLTQWPTCNFWEVNFGG